MSVTYYTIKLELSGQAPGKLYCQQEKDELFLSANGVLSGLFKMAHLETSELAGQFKDAYMPILQKRYGIDVKVEVEKCSSSRENNCVMTRIKTDSDKARKRLITGIFASNVKP